MAVVPAGLAAAAASAPLLSTVGFPLITLAIWQFFSLVCHQDPSRSLWIAGTPVAVCARCLGIYLGAAAGAWVRAERKPLLQVLVIALAASLLDFLAESAGLHGNWPLVRFALGGVLGVMLGALMTNSLNRTKANDEKLATD